MHDCTRERNRVQKLLEHSNVKIAGVLSDVFGVSGQRMLVALLEGESTPDQIAELARGQAKRKIPQLTEALVGHRMTEHERFLIRSCLRHLACLEEELEDLDAEIVRRLRMPPFQNAFALVQTLPGIGELSAAAILAETGTDERAISGGLRLPSSNLFRFRWHKPAGSEAYSSAGVLTASIAGRSSKEILRDRMSLKQGVA